MVVLVWQLSMFYDGEEALFFSLLATSVLTSKPADEPLFFRVAIRLVHSEVQKDFFAPSDHLLSLAQISLLLLRPVPLISI